MKTGIYVQIILATFSILVRDSIFPDELNMADITPVYKDDERMDKKTYRHISILPSVSKTFEKMIHRQIDMQMRAHLSPFLCGFRAEYSTQYCLLYMLEKWKRVLDKNNVAGALIRDRSKAFDCINHEVLIAKLEAYGSDHILLRYIFSYLSGRKQRMHLVAGRVLSRLFHKDQL